MSTEPQKKQKTQEAKEAHKRYVSEWGKQPCVCECGTTIRRHSLRSHVYSEKHERLMDMKRRGVEPVKVLLTIKKLTTSYVKIE